MSAFLVLLALVSLEIPDPLFPANAIGGGTVVAELRFASGEVKSVDILSGEEPFVSSVQSALTGSRLDAALDSDELVVVYFRYPNVYLMGEGSGMVSPAKPKSSALPYPKSIAHPAYAATSIAQGSVILRADISSDGRVTDVQVVRSTGGLTEASVDAVRAWQFTPAKDRKASHAYVVLVYRLPLIRRR